MAIGLRRDMIYAVLLAALVFGVYANSLGGPFLFDDESLVKGNPLIKNVSGIPALFKKDIFAHDLKSPPASNSYRPLQMSSYALDHFFWGSDPFGYHLTNVFLHIFNMLLVLALARRIFSGSVLPYIVALVFGVHPVNTACVSYISGRADVLAAFFMLASLLFYTKYAGSKRPGALFLSVASYACAVFTKEYAILVLPSVILLYDAVFRKRRDVNVRAYLYYPAVLVFYLPLRLAALSGLNPLDLELSHIDLFSRVLTSLKTLFIDIRILAVPFDLHFARTTGVERSIIGSPYAFLTTLGTLAAVCFLVYAYKRSAAGSAPYRAAFFGLMWFLLSMTPLLNIVPLQVFHADNWLYFPAIGVYIAAASAIGVAIGDPVKGGPGAIRIFVLSAVVFMISYYGYITVARNADYSDQVKFYLSGVKWRPNVKFYRALSGIYGSRGDINTSVEYAKRAIETNALYPSPEVAGAYYNLGISYMNLERYAEAREAFLEVTGSGDAGLKKSASEYLGLIEKKRRSK